jgi:hypothetical protein
MRQNTGEEKRVLRHAGMSENSELTADERRRIPAAAAALDSNPRLSSYRLYRLLRPVPSDDQHKEP